MVFLWEARVLIDDDSEQQHTERRGEGESARLPRRRRRVDLRTAWEVVKLFAGAELGMAQVVSARDEVMVPARDVAMSARVF